MYEVHDYIKSYLGETAEAHDFAKSFLDRRQKINSVESPAVTQVYTHVHATVSYTGFNGVEIYKMCS